MPRYFQSIDRYNSRYLHSEIWTSLPYITDHSKYLLRFHKILFVKLRQGSGKDRQGMALKAKGIKVSGGKGRVTMGHLRITVGQPRVTIGHLSFTPK